MYLYQIMFTKCLSTIQHCLSIKLAYLTHTHTPDSQCTATAASTTTATTTYKLEIAAHAIVLMLVSPNSACWCVATLAKKFWCVAGCNNLACMGSPRASYTIHVPTYLCTCIYREGYLSLYLYLSLYIYIYTHIYVHLSIYIRFYAGWAYRVTSQSLPCTASTACHWQVWFASYWFDSL